MEQLMAAMTERRIRHLPVLDGTALIGIVSIGDVVKRRVSEIQDESQALQDYITQGR
jgi:CBS domain-containing protein